MDAHNFQHLLSNSKTKRRKSESVLKSLTSLRDLAGLKKKMHNLKPRTQIFKIWIQIRKFWK